MCERKRESGLGSARNNSETSFSIFPLKILTFFYVKEKASPMVFKLKRKMAKISPDSYCMAFSTPNSHTNKSTLNYFTKRIQVFLKNSFHECFYIPLTLIE